MAINDTQNRLLKAIGLESSLDRPKAQKTAIDCTVSLCKIMPTPITAKSHEDVKKVVHTTIVRQYFYLKFRGFLKIGERNVEI